MKRAKIITAVFLLFALILSALTPSAYATEKETAADYDYSRAGSVYNTTLNGAELLSLIIGESLSDVEGGLSSPSR